MLTEGFDVWFQGGQMTDAEASACIERVLETGCVTDPRRRSDPDATPPSADEVLADADDERDDFRFYCDEYTDISVTVDRETDGSWAEPSLGFGLVVDGTAGVEYETEKRIVRERLELLCSIVSDVIEVVEPDYGWSAPGNAFEYMADAHATGRPVVDHVDRIGWLTVMSPRVVDEFGGYERIRAAPADRITEYDTGHVLLRKTDSFLESSNPRLESYLLGDHRSSG